MICPKCNRDFPRLLALSRTDNETMICDECGTKEALDTVGFTEGSPSREAILKEAYHKKTPQDRVKAVVAATGNRWAMEKQKEMITYCDENDCSDCPFHNTSKNTTNA